ncbi:MAG: Spy/CpxP family protein refolding chaperone [Polaromonas sp.]|uniref:Spy/CpxP family protein refolding chaperone n=1 Tax=Polaromonas sp. TaxID=1869339 RepID=UPI0024898B29|nr:Spy/CpxP family protein refolding chaperone [Polaromonas sp.]MDI1271162.1 Spy/CpxP family protein refolding chaperone [Polaromonas sp.]
MTSMFKPLKSVQSLVLAGIMATAALAATAQTVAPAAPATAGAPAKAGGHHGDRMGRHDPAQMQARIAKHQADLKAQLKLTPAQEGAWTNFTASMQPPVHGARPDRAAMKAEFDKLTTPERIDKMRALRAQRMTEMNAAMDKRGEATKTFYAALSPEQQKVFDSQRMGRGGKGQGGHHGQHHKG